MYAQYFKCLLLVPLAVLAAGDFRARTVSLWWLLVFCALTIVVSLIVNGLHATFVNVALNSLLLVYIAAGVAIWLRVRHRRWINPLQGHIGTGDMIFMLALTPLFGQKQYLIFLISAFVFSLIWALTVRLAGRKSRDIPLVATMGVALSAIIIFNAFI